MRKRKVYIGGTVGRVPHVVTDNLTLAMIKMLEGVSVPGTRDEIGYPERWDCGFIDGDPVDISWTVTVDGVALYIVRYDVDTIEDE